VRSTVRTVLGVLAVWTVSLAEVRYVAFLSNGGVVRGWWSMWLSWIGEAAGAGFLYGLAVWLPFTNVRHLWSRLFLG
jgi:hypothetical protein